MAQARLRHLQLLVDGGRPGQSQARRGRGRLSQPAATQALAELEQLLELRLFERHSKGMRLTAAGSIADAGHSQRAGGAAGRDRGAGHAAGRRERRPAGRRDHRRVASAVLGERVLRFCARHPDMRVEILEDAADHLVQELLSRQPEPGAGPASAALARETALRGPACRRSHRHRRPETPAGRAPGPEAEDLGGYAWMRAAPRGVDARGLRRAVRATPACARACTRYRSRRWGPCRRS